MVIGEYATVDSTGDDIRKGIVPLNFKGADTVLFNLLGFILDAGRDIAQLKEVLEGQVEQNYTATTTMALIEQGLKVFSAIYKRIHKALGDELELVREWNWITTNPLYDSVLDLPEGVDPAWFNDADLNFVPVSDPTIVTDLQRAARAQFHMQFIEDPYHDPIKVRQKIYEGMNAGEFKEVAAGQDPEKEQLKQQLQELAGQLQAVGAELEQVKNDRQFDAQLKAMQEQRETNKDEFDRQLKVLSEKRQDMLAETQAESNRANAAKTVAEIQTLTPDPKSALEEADKLVEPDFVFDMTTGAMRARQVG